MISRKLKNKVLLGMLCAQLAAVPVAYADGPKITTGYNAVELGATNTENFRTRLLTDVGINYHDFELRFNGLNETNDINNEAYYGRNVFDCKKAGSTTSAIGVVKTTNQGVLDAKAGVRETGIPKRLGGYGFVDLTFDRDAVNFSGFFGKPLYRNVSLELFQSVEKPFHDASSYYTELQSNVNIYRNLSGFARVEVYDFKFNNPTLIAGATIH
jgi:hypothetical protein